MLPRDVPGFTGRAGELDRLAGLAGGGSVVVTAIGGTAGVGKTALAVHAAHRLRPKFPDGHLYADLRGYTEGQAPADPGELLEVFLRRLGVATEEMPAGVEERSGLLRQLLASRRVLMLLDNVATEAQVRPLLPGAGGSLVLITSRSVLAGLEADERIDLDVLSVNEATRLLATLIGPQRAAAESEAVEQVRDWCGCLPLALRIAGQLLAAHPAWPVARLAGMLADERGRLGQLSAGDQQVRAAFVVSYRLLEDGDARLFRLLGLHPGPGFNAAAAASLAGIDPVAAGPILNRLALANLITEDASGNYGMHDLLRLFARGTCLDTDGQVIRDAAEGRLVCYYLDLAGLLNASLDPQLRAAATQAAEQARSLPSPREALAIFETERPSLLAALHLAAARGSYEMVWQLGENMGDPLRLLRYLDDLLTVAEAALAAARHAGDTSAEGRALGTFGIANRELRRFEEAITSYQQALGIFRATADWRGEGQTLNNLGVAYQEVRRFEEAITCYQRALGIFQASGDRYDEGQTLNNLGNTYQQLRRFEEAITCHQDALELRRETGDQYGEGQTLNNLGNAYQQLRRFEEAITCHKDARGIFGETGVRHGEGRTLGNLGSAYRGLRRFEEAITSYQQALGIFRETGDRYDEGQTLNNLGNAYREVRRFEEAIACYEDALGIFRKTGDRYDEGQTLNNLGNAYQELRRFEEAIPCHQDALGIFRETGDRYDKGQTLNNLGSAYQELRRFEEAITCYEDALRIFRETGDRYDEGQTLNNLGNAFQEVRRFEEAIACYTQDIAICHDAGDRYGEGQTLNNLGNAYQELRQPDQAAICWRDAAAAMRDAADNEAAARLEQQASNARARRRHWRRTRLTERKRSRPIQQGRVTN